MGTGEALHRPHLNSMSSSYLPPPPNSGIPLQYNPSVPTPHGTPSSSALDQMDMPSSSSTSSSSSLGSCLLCCNPHVNILLEPCHHHFHANCIEQALDKDKICPTCWTPIQTSRRLPYTVRNATNSTSMSTTTTTGSSTTTKHSHLHDGSTTRGTCLSSCIGKTIECSSTQLIPNLPITMRKGKWTAEESAYCDRLIEEFKKGNLPLAEGTTLRTFLSKLLNCDPMRISKKYTGDQCIGKIIFRRREDEVSKDDMENIRKDLAELEKTYLEREQYNQRRREKRLESELSRDKNRFGTTRSIGYAGGISATAMSPHSHSQQQQQQQQQGGYSSAPVRSTTKQEPRSVPVQQPSGGYGTPGRGGCMPVQPPLHPPQQGNNNVPSHLFNGDHNNVLMLGIAGVQTQSQGQVQDNNSPSSLVMDGNLGDAFPRVSSIDSFSCLFPRVASIENFQHATSSGFGGMNPNGPYVSTESQDTMMSGLSRPLSVGESLNAYFPRIQSLEHLSSLLQDHGLSTPTGATTALAAQNTRDATDKSSDSNKQSSKEHTLSGSTRRRLGENIMDEEQQREGGENAQSRPNSSSTTSNTNSSVVCTTTSASGTFANTGATKRLSPSHNASASSGSGNQIQIPKPLNKMPRSSSGIFPRVPSMDKMPRVPSADKLSRVASLDKLPRIPSMDKLHAVGGGEQRIPRVPSSDKMARVPSLDMLSRFGSSDHLSSFPSFSNLSALSSSASYDKLSSLGGFKSGFPRNSSIEDILSLVASSESTGLPSNGSTLQLSALAAVAGEESSHLVANERKRRLETSQQDAPLTADHKKNKLSA